MEERLTQLGEWLRPNGEAIYTQRMPGRGPRSGAPGNIPHLEQSEFMSEYDITNLVDNPRAGFARMWMRSLPRKAMLFTPFCRAGPRVSFVLTNVAASSYAQSHAG